MALTTHALTPDGTYTAGDVVLLNSPVAYGVITTTIKHAVKLTVKLKTSPCTAKLAQVYRTVRRHWLQLTTKC